nr:MAG TPA: hypothetical protein [Crassvirales sp.]
MQFPPSPEGLESFILTQSSPLYSKVPIYEPDPLSLSQI